MDRFLGPQVYKVNKSVEDDSELRIMKSKAKKEGEKVFIQMIINDYICKGKTWEDMQKTFRPSGAMSKWTRDIAELLGLKTTTNYRLMSPSVSPASSPESSPKKGSMKKGIANNKSKQRKWKKWRGPAITRSVSKKAAKNKSKGKSKGKSKDPSRKLTRRKMN